MKKYYYVIKDNNNNLIKKSAKFKNLESMLKKANSEKVDGAGNIKACYYFGEYIISYYCEDKDITEELYYLN